MRTAMTPYAADWSRMRSTECTPQLPPAVNGEGHPVPVRAKPTGAARAALLHLKAPCTCLRTHRNPVRSCLARDEGEPDMNLLSSRQRRTAKAMQMANEGP